MVKPPYRIEVDPKFFYLTTLITEFYLKTYFTLELSLVNDFLKMNSFFREQIK